MIFAEEHDWHDVRRHYARLKERWMKNYGGKYLLVHVETVKWAIGDPTKDDKGGYADALLKFRAYHGDLMGQYFGVLIPKQK